MSLLDALRPTMRSDGRSHFPRWEKWLTSRRFSLHRALELELQIVDGDERYILVCAGIDEVVRGRRMLAREEGTVEWLRSELHAGDVLYDVGANIGVFTLIAARRLGESGHVYAFEPHPANRVALIENVARNGVGSSVTVVAAPLDAEERWGSFVYGDRARGTGMSDFASPERDCRADRELSLATTLDRMLASGVVPPPSLVKIDVDGGELRVLAGMRGLLTGPDRPRALQVEVSPDRRDELLAFLDEAGYDLADRHYTAAGAARLETESVESVPFNGIFCRSG